MDKELKIVIAMVAGFIAAMLIVMWYAAGVESELFNRLTGNEVTQWEALWTNLRVDCN